MTSDLSIAPMSLQELESVLDWAAAEGWNPGLGDAEAFLATDPGGFFLAKSGDTPVAAISVVNLNMADAFLGLYICPPESRNMGYGIRIWSHALSHAGDRSVGLDGVPAQEANYRASGFVRVGASLRHVGRWPANQTPDIRAATSRDLPTLIAMDAQAGGVDRPAFLSAWLRRNDSMRGSRVLVRDGAIAGFATWRACRTGTKIGPILAPDTAGALALVADIAHLRPEGPLIVDIPEANAPLRRALEEAGFEVPFATARMYRGRAPETGPMLQAIATMELG